MHTLAKQRRFWTDGILPWETNFQDIPSSFEHVDEQGRTGNLPPCTFGMGDVKEENYNMEDTTNDTLSML